jgi:hypothetical protein
VSENEIIHFYVKNFLRNHSQSLPTKFTYELLKVVNDTPPNSLMDLTTNPKVKTTKGKWIGMHSLVCNISRVEGHARALGWDYNEWQAN